MPRKPSDTIKLNLRFSEELRRRLEKAAERNDRSMNLEIVARIEDSFRKEDIKDVMRESFREFTLALESKNPTVFADDAWKAKTKAK